MKTAYYWFSIIVFMSALLFFSMMYWWEQRFIALLWIVVSSINIGVAVYRLRRHTNKLKAEKIRIDRLFPV